TETGTAGSNELQKRYKTKQPRMIQPPGTGRGAAPPIIHEES
ncbi:20179_t:CDS:1, partial [Rhizophagus irregularis]